MVGGLEPIVIGKPKLLGSAYPPPKKVIGPFSNYIQNHPPSKTQEGRFKHRRRYVLIEKGIKSRMQKQTLEINQQPKSVKFISNSNSGFIIDEPDCEDELKTDDEGI